MGRCILPIAVAGAALVACDIGTGTDVVVGNGQVVTEDRSAQGVRGIALETIGTVVVVQADSEAIRLEGESNLLDEIVTELDGTTLRIRTRGGVSIRATEPLTVTVSVEEVRGLVLSSSGAIRADTLQVDELAVVNSGSGAVTLDVLATGQLTTVVSGSGGVSVDSLAAAGVQTTLSGPGPVAAAGSAGRHVIVVSGSGSLHAPELATQTVEAVLSGSGSAVVRVAVRLDVVVSGSGSLSYYGSPTLNQTVTGSGSVQKLGD